MEEYELIVEWPDKTWCFVTDLCEMTHMSDDYQIMPMQSRHLEDVC